MPTVTKVRKERSRDWSHEHLEGVCTATGDHYTRAQVVASIAAGNRWVTRSYSGSEAVMRPIAHCHSCDAAPYITTRPDNSKDNNLESLPPC